MNYFTDYPINPTCRPPAIMGKRSTDRWCVYFYYYEEGKRKMYRTYNGLNEPSLNLSDRKKRSLELVKVLDDKLRTIPFDFKTKTFIEPVPDTQILQDLIAEYLAEVKPRVVYHTFANYNTIFKVFKEQTTGCCLQDINKDFMKSFFKGIDVKPQSKRSYKTYISVFFNWLIDEKGLSIKNPTHDIKIPNNLPVERHRVHSKNDIRKIIKYCDSRNDIILKTIIYLIYGAQIRISEILKIQLRDFKIDENKIVLPKGKGKVKSKIKTVLLDEPLKQFLLNLPVDYEDTSILERYFIGIDAPFKKSKFAALLPLSTDTIGSRFKKLKRDLGIEENKTLYSFKHTGNVNLLINGADLIELMYKNGHTKISQTETYARQLIEQVPEVKYIRKTRDDIDFI